MTTKHLRTKKVATAFQGSSSGVAERGRDEEVENLKKWTLCALVGCLPCAGGGCGGRTGDIRVDGSNTMVNLAQAWAEQYGEIRPDVSVQVKGGGSGVGIATLIDGMCDVANADREMKDEEKERVKANHEGNEAKELVVGYDALAVYVHKDNPLDSISIEELAEIYGDGGKITDWSAFGLPAGSPASGEIAVVSRQNSSGTFFYFREAVLGKNRDYRLDAVKMNGSKDVVAHVSNTPAAIAYGGMGYATGGVKILKVSEKKGEPGIAPTVENAQNGTYPITRPLRIYTVGEPTGKLKEYLDWILSPEGQRIVLELGYVPLEKDE